jgi:hypothetical protein
VTRVMWTKLHFDLWKGVDLMDNWKQHDTYRKTGSSNRLHMGVYCTDVFFMQSDVRLLCKICNLFISTPNHLALHIRAQFCHESPGPSETGIVFSSP